MAVPVRRITSAHARTFRDEGFFVVDGALPRDDLETLRAECLRIVDERDREMTRLGVDRLDLCHRGRRYFVHAYGKSPAVERFLSSDIMVQCAQAALGESVYLFNEQYVVKAAERGMTFGWHQDSGFIPHPHPPYLTCWIPLDDVTEANGTVYYVGDDPGDPVVTPAGSIACFSSTLFHRGGPNTTDRSRRVYIAQYSAEPILSQDRSRPRHLAEPLLIAGRRTGSVTNAAQPRTHALEMATHTGAGRCGARTSTG